MFNKCLFLPFFQYVHVFAIFRTVQKSCELLKHFRCVDMFLFFKKKKTENGNTRNLIAKW